MKKLFYIFTVGLVGISYPMKGEVTTPALSYVSHENKIVTIMQTKLCTDCGQEKPLSEFHKCKTTKTGIQVYCKVCQNRHSEDYQRTKSGLITKIYVHQKVSSKRRGRNMPTYTKNELKDWCHGQELFHELFDNWKESNFDKKLLPSCDRIDNHKGYSFDNIQLMTWQENDDKGKREKMKAVVGTHKLTGDRIEFCSLTEAAIALNTSASTISSCCCGKMKTSARYFWQYKL